MLLFHDRESYHIETSPLIWGGNQCTSFYMITASVMKELMVLLQYYYDSLFSWVCHYWHVNLFEVEEFIVYSFWRVLTWDFISGKMKYFHFGFWSISYNCLHETTQNGTHCGCHFIAVILAEMNFFFFFISGDKTSCKHYPKWNHWNAHAFISSKQIWFVFPE